MPDATLSTDTLALLRQVTVAADRLIDRWSESDEGVRRDLWQGLSTATAAAYDVVYPLPAEDDETPHHHGGIEVDCGDKVTLDLAEPRVKNLLDAIEHIEAAMALVDKNGGPFASLASAKSTLSEFVGSMLLNRSRDALKAKQSGRATS